MENLCRKSVINLVAVCAVLTAVNNLNAASQKLDYAVEDAAYKTVKQLYDADNINVNRLAFVGLFGVNEESDHDVQNLIPVFRAGLVSARGEYGVQVPQNNDMVNLAGQNYKFYIRDQQKWDDLVSEIEFGKRREDVMDKSTIAEFGDIKGVQAILDGQIMEARVTDEGGFFRVAMFLTNVETGEQMWAGNISGRYKVEDDDGKKKLTASIRQAAEEAGNELTEKFSKWSDKQSDKLYNIYLLPLRGHDYARKVSDIVTAEVVNAGSGKLRFYSTPASPVHQRMRRRIARETDSGEAGSSTDLSLMMKQLDNMFDVEKQGDKAEGTSSQDSPTIVNTVLSGRITGVDNKSSLLKDKTEISMLLKLRTLESGIPQVLLGENITTTVEEPWYNAVLSQMKRSTAGAIIAIAVGALIILFLLSKMIKAASRPR